MYPPLRPPVFLFGDNHANQNNHPRTDRRAGPVHNPWRLAVDPVGAGAMTMTEEQIKRHLERKISEAEGLNQQYPPGVRPSWVSGELSILWVQIDNLKKQLEEMQCK